MLVNYEIDIWAFFIHVRWLQRNTCSFNYVQNWRFVKPTDTKELIHKKTKTIKIKENLSVTCKYVSLNMQQFKWFFVLFLLILLISFNLH